MTEKLDMKKIYEKYARMEKWTVLECAYLFCKKKPENHNPKNSLLDYEEYHPHDKPPNDVCDILDELKRRPLDHNRHPFAFIDYAILKNMDIPDDLVTAAKPIFVNHFDLDESLSEQYVLSAKKFIDSKRLAKVVNSRKNNKDYIMALLLKFICNKVENPNLKNGESPNFSTIREELKNIAKSDRTYEDCKINTCDRVLIAAYKKYEKLQAKI